MSDEELVEQVARAICVANDCDPDTMFEGSPIWVDWKDDAKAAINLPALSAWRNAVIDELCSLHIYSAEHDADPRKAVRDIIEWNQRLALDPAVSAEALALHKQGWNEAIEAAAIAYQAEAETWLQLPVRGSCSRLGAQAIRALTKENSDGAD